MDLWVNIKKGRGKNQIFASYEINPGTETVAQSSNLKSSVLCKFKTSPLFSPVIFSIKYIYYLQVYYKYYVLFSCRKLYSLTLSLFELSLSLFLSIYNPFLIEIWILLSWKVFLTVRIIQLKNTKVKKNTTHFQHF